MLLTAWSSNVKPTPIIPQPTVTVAISEKVEDVSSAVEPELTSVELDRESKMDQEVLTATLRTNRVVLSRGGSPFKQKTEHEIINDYVRDISAKYNMDPTLIMSVIQQESEYNPKAKNGNCLGLMQVSSYWHRDRASKLGITDFYDAYSNILLGVDYLSELYTKHKDMRLVLMLYNMEHNTAISMFKNGQISSYAKTIIARAEQYKKGE
jgi:soluble lytic murein transglycosylase-like protein